MDRKQKQNSKKRGEKSPKTQQRTRVEGKAPEPLKAAHGEVVTSIFSNPDGRGGFAIRFVQEREYQWEGKTHYAKAFRPEDALDVINGAAWASRTIQERQREDRRRGSLPGSK